MIHEAGSLAANGVVVAKPDPIGGFLAWLASGRGSGHLRPLASAPACRHWSCTDDVAVGNREADQGGVAGVRVSATCSSARRKAFIHVEAIAVVRTG